MLAVTVSRRYSIQTEQFSGTSNGPKTPKGICRIFINGIRPFDGVYKENKVIEDFAWRRTVDLSGEANDPALQLLIKTFLNEKGFTKLDDRTVFSFHRYVGCGMCPCSPGIIVNHPDYTSVKKGIWEVWIDIEENTTTTGTEAQEEAAVLGT